MLIALKCYRYAPFVEIWTGGDSVDGRSMIHTRDLGCVIRAGRNGGV